MLASAVGVGVGFAAKLVVTTCTWPCESLLELEISEVVKLAPPSTDSLPVSLITNLASLAFLRTSFPFNVRLKAIARNIS